MPRKNSVCQSCQARHLKCVREEVSGPCQRCEEEGIAYEQDTSLRVRHVLSVSGTKRKRLRYDQDQIWVPVPPSLEFASPEKQRYTPSEEEESELQVETPDRQHPLGNVSSTETWGSSAQGYEPDTRIPSHENPNTFHGTLPSISKSPNNAFENHNGTKLNGSPALTTGSAVSHQFNQRSPRVGAASSIYASPVSHTSRTPGYSNSSPWPIESENEARLFLHFVNRLSMWLDTFDSARHFSTEVARRAAYVPVIMNAILASAARHFAFISGTADTMSENYHNKCLQILIPVLDDPCDVLDENLCAAIIILRQYEEYDETDERCHLFGSTRMVNTITPNTMPSTLRDAANWVALRQEIHISLTNKQPVSIILDAYRQSPKFTSDSEDGWANRIVFLFAKVLNYAFRSEDTIAEESWSTLQEQIESWYSMKPPYFAPLWAANDGDARVTPFPQVVMLGPAQANGMQHYYLAKILLAAYDPRLLKLGFDTRKLRKESEENVLQNLRMVIGLATSNPRIETTFMHASHMLTACGDYLTDPEEQAGVVDFLRDIENRGIWRTTSIISRLQDQWK